MHTRVVNRIIKSALLLTIATSHTSSAAEVAFASSIDASYFSIEGSNENTALRGLAELSLSHTQNNTDYFISAQMLRGDNGSDEVGDIQAFSNIDEAEFSKLYEYWVQYSPESLDGRFKVGQVDLNNEFAFAENAGDFINSSMGFSPTIAALPTYPVPALSLIYTQRITEHVSVAGAVSAGDGNNSFDDTFYISEMSFRNDSLTLKAGAWHHTGSVDRLDKGGASHTQGWYALVEGHIGHTELGYFLQYGDTDQALSIISRHIGAGIIKSCNIGNQPVTLGLGLTTVNLSEHANTQRSWEKVLELFAKFEISEHVTLKPDLQYIMSPSGDNRNELVSTLRVDVAF